MWSVLNSCLKEEDLMDGGRDFQRAVVEGTKEDCVDFVQENGITMFDGR